MKTLVDSITHWDFVFLNSIFGLNGRRLIRAVMPWFSHSGNGYYYPAIPFFFYLIDPHIARSFFIIGITSFAIELPLYKAVKHLIKRDRPCKAVSGVYPRISPSDLFSFPSGHTAAAFLIATLIGYSFPVLWAPAFIWALLVGVSRIYLGVHYPSDILAGLFIGVSCAFAGIKAFA
jgi:undecaprenyl-diphosphatase